MEGKPTIIDILEEAKWPTLGVESAEFGEGVTTPEMDYGARRALLAVEGAIKAGIRTETISTVDDCIRVIENVRTKFVKR